MTSDPICACHSECDFNDPGAALDYSVRVVSKKSLSHHDVCRVLAADGVSMAAKRKADLSIFVVWREWWSRYFAFLYLINASAKSNCYVVSYALNGCLASLFLCGFFFYVVPARDC